MLDELRNRWRSGSMLYRLIALNFQVFMCVSLLHIIFKFQHSEYTPEISNLFGLATTASLEDLVTRPWSVVTYMFAHKGLWHISMNMILLWWMGRMYQSEVGSRRLLSTYVLGGLAGCLSLIICLNVFPQLSQYLLSPVYGASAAVMAIFTATATLNPTKKINFVLFGAIQLQHVAIAYVALDYFLNNDGNMGSFIGHLGGAVMGVFLITQKRKGRDLAKWLEWIFDKVMTLLPSRLGGSKAVFKVKRKKKSSRPKSDEQFNSERRDSQVKLDAILDKVSRHGYDHLTKDEKKFLFNQSKN